MENLTMQELLDMQEKELSKLNVGDEIVGKVSAIHNDRLVLDLDVDFDGVIPVSELNLQKDQFIADVYKIDEEVKGIITNISYKDATIKISKAKLEQLEDTKELYDAMENHTKITVHAYKALDRGLYVQYKSHSMFMPISQIDTKFVKDTQDYVGMDLECYIKELNPRKNRIIVSHRDVAQEILDEEKRERKERMKAERERIKAKKEEKKARREAVFATVKPGDKLNGKVTNIMSYGAFIDIGDVEGLAHINNLSWTRVESVESVLNEGDEVVVYVESVDPESQRISLSLKDPDQDPWKLVADELSLDDEVEAKVLRIIEKGAFLEVKPGVEAYMPISELAEERTEKVEDVVNIGDVVKAVIVKYNPESKRMMLSMRAVRKPYQDLEESATLGTIAEALEGKIN